jgi:hypothetical protein
MPEKEKNTKKSDEVLKKASVQVGKALARSTHKVEETGRKAKTAAGNLVKTASRKAEKSVETTMAKVKSVASRPKAASPKAKAPAASPLRPRKELDVTGHIGFLAGEVYHYLAKHGESPVEKVVSSVKNSSNSEALIYSALGWLARECKVAFSADGSSVTLLP